MLKPARYRVGHWTFTPSAHELRSGQTTIRLQQRASATLALLCERAGEVVSRDEIIERGWGRRHLSPNSVAIVIGDLRRALAIGAGKPGSIETLPKAGYRLVPSSELPIGAPSPRTPILAATVAVFAAICLAGAWLMLARPAAPEVAVGSIDNAMGTERFAPLIHACSETLLVDLGREGAGLRIVETTARPRSADYVLQQRWVLWSGAPELVLVALDRSGNSVWSGAIYGPQDQFPAKISDKVRQFATFARARSRS